jgi:hypothetical protein
MENSRKGIMRVKNLWARFALLVIIFFPIFIPIIGFYDASVYMPHEIPDQIKNMVPYLIYMAIVYFFIVRTFGLAGLGGLLLIATPIALSVSLARGITPHIPYVGIFLQGSKPDIDRNFLSIMQFVKMLVLIPGPLFVIKCFPAHELISKIKTSKNKPEYLIKIAIISRMFVVVTEAVSKFWNAWNEENPNLILPRYRIDISTSQKLVKSPLWLLGASKTWCFALVVYCIEQIPPLMYQIDNILAPEEN